MKAKFTHDCTQCVLVGQDDEHDFYYCSQISRPTVIARYGNDGPDYESGLECALSMEQSYPTEPLVLALQAARQKGFIK